MNRQNCKLEFEFYTKKFLSSVNCVTNNVNKIEYKLRHQFEHF